MIRRRLHVTFIYSQRIGDMQSPHPTLKSLRNGSKDTETTLTEIKGGVELIKQAGQKQQKFPSYADYLRYKKAIPHVQNKSGQ